MITAGTPEPAELGDDTTQEPPFPVTSSTQPESATNHLDIETLTVPADQSQPEAMADKVPEPEAPKRTGWWSRTLRGGR